MIGVLVLEDRSLRVGRVGDGAGQSDSDEVGAAPRAYACLALEPEKASVAGDMRCDGNRPFLGCQAHHVDRVVIGDWRSLLAIGDAALADEAFYPVQLRPDLEEDQEVNSVGAHDLDAGEGRDARLLGRLQETASGSDAEVVGDRDYFYFVLLATGDDRLVVGIFTAEAIGLAVAA